MRTGLFGGSFDPPHSGHLHIASVFYREMRLERLFVMPAHVSPFKTESAAYASGEDRYRMAQLLFSGMISDGKNVTVDRFELDRDICSYTFETVRHLLKAHDEKKLYLCVGSDMFLSFERWKNARELFDNCILFTQPRFEGERELLSRTADRFRKEYGALCFVSDSPELVVSSTRIRDELRNHNDKIARNLLTESVFGYIMENKLYNTGEA